MVNDCGELLGNIIVIDAGAIVTAGRGVAAVTVSVVLPETLPKVAVISDEPAPTPVARPLETTVAAGVVPEVQLTEAVMSLDVPSE